MVVEQQLARTERKPSRRTAGEGTVFRRKDGRWQVALQVNGQRITRYGRTRAEAASKLRELQRLAPTPHQQVTWYRGTLNDLLNRWLETKVPNVRPRTMADYREICDRYLRPALGKDPLGSISPDRIQRLYAEYQNAGKARTALKIARVLSQALDLAVRWGWLPSNPCNRVDTPRYRPARKQIWTPEELRHFLGATRDHWLHPFWVLAASTGARIGELLALGWSDLALDAGVMDVRRSVQVIDGRRVIGTPKTQAGIRRIGLPSATISTLRSWQAKQAEQRLRMGDQWKAGEHVFSSPQGQPLSASTVQDALPRECSRLNLPRMTPHGFRHLHASALLAQGLPIPAVSQRLGHANGAVTMSIYAHALPESDLQATEAIGRVMKAATALVRR